MFSRPLFAALCLSGLTLMGCAGPGASGPSPTSASASAGDFARWTCAQIADEIEQLQRRAATVAFAPGNYAGQGVLALGSGLNLYWPAILATRPSGIEARDPQALKARYDSLHSAATPPRCQLAPQAWSGSSTPASGDAATSATAAAVPAMAPMPQPGDRYFYEDRRNVRSAAQEWSLLAQQVSGNQTTYLGSGLGLGATPSAMPVLAGTWVLDTAGNVAAAPDGSLWWPQLLRSALMLGQVTAGDIMLAGDPLARARMRGQIIAVGQQTVAGQRFDAAVLELFGDAPIGNAYTRVEGVIVVDRATGTLLRLDLRSAHPAFNLQRRLLRLQTLPR